MEAEPDTGLAPPGELRTLRVRIALVRGQAEIELREADGPPLALPGWHAADIVAAMTRRIREARGTGQSPGAGLYGDLFCGAFGGPVEEAVAWAAAAPGRRLHLEFASCDALSVEWPLELLVHPTHGLLAAQPWARILRTPADGWPAEPGADRLPVRVARWRAALERALAARAEQAQQAGRSREALAHLRGLLAVQRRAGRPAAVARTLAALAPVLDRTEGPAAALAAAEGAAHLAHARRAWLTRRRAWRFLADLLARRGDAAAAERLLERCLASAARRRDLAAESDDRTALVQLLFDQRRDREAARAAPAARRACRRAGRFELEGQLDLALAHGALRHGHVRAARHLFRNAAARLGRAGRPEGAAAAATNLGFLLLHERRDELAAGVFVAALQGALQAADRGRDAAGVVVEGILAPLVADVAPHLLRRRRPDAVVATGVLLLWLSGPKLRATDPGPLPDPLRLLVGWVGRYLRLVGWVAAAGAVVRDGASALVADRLARRARAVGAELERLSGGAFAARRLHEAAVAAAHRVVRGSR
jgi:tetratricopeptide (TPR) repeat protein